MELIGKAENVIFSWLTQIILTVIREMRQLLFFLINFFFKGALDVFLGLINKDNFGQGCLYSIRVDMNYLESYNDGL